MEMDTEMTPAEQGAGAGAVLAGAVLATLRPDAAKQMDVQYEAEGDDTMNEQTWPTVSLALPLPLPLPLPLTLTTL